MSDFLYLNGRFIRSTEAVLPADHAGFLYGDGLFETLRSYKGNIFAFEKHLDRLFLSMHELLYNPSYSKEFLKEKTDLLLRKNKLSENDAYIKIIVTRRGYKEKFRFDFWLHPDLIIIVKKLSPYPESYYSHGVKIIKSSIQRPQYGNSIYRYKLLSYFENIFAKNEAYSANAIEAFFMTKDRVVLEGTTSNIFIVKDGKIYTIPTTLNILPGITRQVVIDICDSNNIKIHYKRLHYYNLLEADEVFITNSIMEIMPVSAVDNHTLDKGEIPGEITTFLMNAYKKLTVAGWV